MSGAVTPPAWPEQPDWIELVGIPDLLALQRADPRRFPVLLESAADGTPRGLPPLSPVVTATYCFPSTAKVIG